MARSSRRTEGSDTRIDVTKGGRGPRGTALCQGLQPCVVVQVQLCLFVNQERERRLRLSHGVLMGNVSRTMAASNLTKYQVPAWCRTKSPFKVAGARLTDLVASCLPARPRDCSHFRRSLESSCLVLDRAPVLMLHTHTQAGLPCIQSHHRERIKRHFLWYLKGYRNTLLVLQGFHCKTSYTILF